MEEAQHEHRPLPRRQCSERLLEVGARVDPAERGAGRRVLVALDGAGIRLTQFDVAPLAANAPSSARLTRILRA